MARTKVNLQWICNKATRRATLKKRQASLMKKTSDLVSLCGIKACVVVYGEGEPQPKVWPSILEATQLLNNFKVVPDNLGNYKKTLSQEDFLRSRISRLHDMLVKSDRETRERDSMFLLQETMSGNHSCLIGRTNEELTNLNSLVERKIKNMEQRFHQVIIGHGQPLQASSLQPTPFLSQQQAPNNDTELQSLMPTEEPQPKEHDLLMKLTQNRGEQGAMVFNAFSGSNNVGDHNQQWVG